MFQRILCHSVAPLISVRFYEGNAQFYIGQDGCETGRSLLDHGRLLRMRLYAPVKMPMCAVLAFWAKTSGRVDVSEPASISSGIAKRYATAIFDLAKEGKSVPALSADIDALETALNDSADLADLTTSPVYSREEQAAAIAAVAKKMKISPIVTNSLALMAQNRRLFALPQLFAALRDMIAEENGELTADVIAAKALTKTQSDKLAKTLKATFGKDVKINATVDESIIGGLIVKVGSKMIDTSVASKLSNLQNAMKEVG